MTFTDSPIDVRSHFRRTGLQPTSLYDHSIDSWGKFMLGTSRLVAFAATTNFAVARFFYGDTLGLRLMSETPFALEFKATGGVLRITKVETVVVAPYTTLGWDVDDITSTVGALTGRGVRFERYTALTQDAHGVWRSPGGAWIAWFKDPDGNLLSLTQSG
jgi:catechol 2,3-dioxygenase-like lactoylglutathione lyase family enzyme